MVKELLSEFAATPVRYQMGGIPLSKAYQMCSFSKIEKLSANENAFGVSPKAKEAVQNVLPNACFYPNIGDYQIKEKLAVQQKISPEQIILTHGGTIALTLIGEVFLRPGDEIVYAAPTYQAYQNMARKGCAIIKEVPMDKEMHIDFPKMREAVTEKTKLVILCNPNNPTGGYETKDKMLAFIDSLPEHVVVLVDEAYIQFAGGLPFSMVPYISEERNLIVVQTFSKLYGMAGFRLGYVMSNREIIGYLNGDMDAYEPSVFALAAGDAALEDIEFMQMTLERTKEGKEYLTEELQKLGVKVYPSYTNFIMFDCGINAQELTRRVLEKSGVLIRGTFSCPRITIGTMEQNRKFIHGMQEILARKDSYE